MQRARGTTAPWEMAEFGELVLYRPLGEEKKRKKVDPRWQYGVFLGVATRSNEVYMGTEDGVVKAWAFRRLRTQDRWDAAKVLGVKGSPTKPDPNSAGSDVQTHIMLAAVVRGAASARAQAGEGHAVCGEAQGRVGLRLHGQVRGLQGGAAREPVSGALGGV